MTATLPARPLADAIHRMIHRSGATDPNDPIRTAMFDDLRISSSHVSKWRNQPRATVTLDVADRVLSASPYMWFDIWPECRAHPTPALGCVHCHSHYAARLAFTGARLPAELQGTA